MTLDILHLVARLAKLKTDPDHVRPSMGASSGLTF